MSIPQALCAIVLLGGAAPAHASFATQVLEYDPGAGAAEGFDDPTTALGEPTRFTSPDSPFGGAVTPFNAPFGTDEVVSIGVGGTLVVAFDEPVTDDPLNPFGIDLLVFGNAFLRFGDSSPTSEGGGSEGSADGVTWVAIDGVAADGPFPTLGYADVTEPFPAEPGEVLTDFTRPVDPAFDPTGLSLAEIIDAYDGSGGGAGVDLAGTGLDAISFVRITNLDGALGTPEIDAFADVAAIPAPATLLIAPLTLLARRRR